MSQRFKFHQKVLFKHCDPAGIVFYPRYFEIMNDCVEAFFDEIGFAFEDIHTNGAVPTARIETRFVRPSRHGDILDISLGLKRIGKSSLTVEIATHCDAEERMSFTATLVNVDANGTPTPWPAAMRSAFTPFQLHEN